jgi:hypothetical protein
MGLAVEILFLGAMVPEICLGSFLTPMVLRVCEIGTGLQGLTIFNASTIFVMHKTGLYLTAFGVDNLTFMKGSSGGQ